MIDELFYNKKKWLDYLFYKIGKQKYNFYVCGTFGDRQFTKWKTYFDSVAVIDVLGENNDWKELKYFEQINQRQILPNEIVLDIEEKEELPRIKKQLDEWGWIGKLFSTGSRGYHIHIFSKDNFTKEEKESVIIKLGTDIQKATKKNLIALEYSPHWKTGKLKEEIQWNL